MVLIHLLRIWPMAPVRSSDSFSAPSRLRSPANSLPAKSPTTDHSVTVDFKKGELVFEEKAVKKQDSVSRLAFRAGQPPSQSEQKNESRRWPVLQGSHRGRRTDASR